jgi:hypothetical protein
MKTAVALAFLLAACSSNHEDVSAPDAAATAPDAIAAVCAAGSTDPTCHLGDAPADTWTYYSIPGTQCIDGQPAGFSVNPHAGATKLLVYLEGGGACFNDFCDSIFQQSGHQPGGAGIWDRSNASNPVADYTMVYVPYCTGDIFGGDADTVVGNTMRHFHGYTNFTAFLTRWVPSFQGMDQVVLAGSSAGGFGAFSNFSQTQRAFGTVPVTLLDDSAPAMSSAVFPPCLQTIFRTTWGLDNTVLADCGADCGDGSDYVRAYMDHVIAQFPNAHGGLFSNTQDQTIRTFAGYGWYGGYNMCSDIPQVVSGQVYQDGLTELRTHLTGSNFSSYYVTGTSHTILSGNGFYSGNPSTASWMNDVIAGQVENDGP